MYLRLKKRKTESDDKINMRISKASEELSKAKLFDCNIENVTLENAQRKAYQTVLNFIKP